jgi:prepilin signal peptidase PulO-like enzyme (type II secretory pathway)
MELLWAVVGWIVGIGLNAVVHELPRSQQLFVRPRCPHCEAPLLAAAFTIAAPSRRAACPGCQAPGVDAAHTLEWPTALVFGALAWCFGASLPLAVYSLYVIFLLVVLVIDLRHRWVYTVVCYPAILAAVVLTAVLQGTSWAGAAGALAGGGLFFLLYWLGRLIYRGQEPMGIGDITIAAMIGGMVGPERILVALFLGGLLVAGVSVVLLLLRRARARDFIPYGAGLCLGALITLFTGCLSGG